MVTENITFISSRGDKYRLVRVSFQKTHDIEGVPVLSGSFRVRDRIPVYSTGKIEVELSDGSVFNIRGVSGIRLAYLDEDPRWSNRFSFVADKIDKEGIPCGEYSKIFK